MGSGIFILLLLAAALIASFVRKSMNEQKNEVGLQKYVIEKGERLSKAPTLIVDVQGIDITVMFCKNCDKVIDQMNPLYGFSFGIGKWNSVMIYWKGNESKKVFLYLRMIENGISKYYPLCRVNMYEEIRVIVETKTNKICVKLSQILKQTFQYEIVNSFPKFTFGYRHYPKLGHEKNFDVELLIKDNK